MSLAGGDGSGQSPSQVLETSFDNDIQDSAVISESPNRHNNKNNNSNSSTFGTIMDNDVDVIKVIYCNLFVCSKTPAASWKRNEQHYYCYFTVVSLSWCNLLTTPHVPLSVRGVVYHLSLIHI